MKTVCIDPGHGGVDPGAIGFVTEKTVVLEIARAAERRLLSYQGVAVRMTRTTDIRLGPTTTEDLAARARFANQAKADVFLSIHCNSNEGPPGTGFETFRHPNKPEAAALQAAIHKRIPALNVRDRGAKTGNLQVLRQTIMSAVLVECLFVNHPLDAELLKDSRFRRLMGEALADGVADYLEVKLVDKEQDYKANEAFRAAVELARAKGLSAPGPGHDYTQPLTEERFWTFMSRLLRWQ